MRNHGSLHNGTRVFANTDAPDCKLLGKAHKFISKKTNNGKQFRECSECGWLVVFRTCPVCGDDVEHIQAHIMAETDPNHVVYLIHNS
jgi:rubrerythrin